MNICNHSSKYKKGKSKRKQYIIQSAVSRKTKLLRMDLVSNTRRPQVSYMFDEQVSQDNETLYSDEDHNFKYCAKETHMNHDSVCHSGMFDHTFG